MSEKRDVKKARRPKLPKSVYLVLRPRPYDGPPFTHYEILPGSIGQDVGDLDLALGVMANPLLHDVVVEYVPSGRPHGGEKRILAARARWSKKNPE